MTNTIALAFIVAGVIMAIRGWRTRPPPAALLLLALPLFGCGSVPLEVAIANAVSVAVDESVPVVADEAKREYVAAAESATSREDGERRLADVERKWSPVEAGIDAVRAAQSPVVAAIESRRLPTGAELRALLSAYCALREAFAGVGRVMPDVPVLGCEVKP